MIDLEKARKILEEARKLIKETEEEQKSWEQERREWEQKIGYGKQPNPNDFSEEEEQEKREEQERREVTDRNEYDETELIYWAEVAECFIETHDCVQSCLENSEEMKGIYERIVRAYHSGKPPSIEDAEKLFYFFADCPRIKKSYDKNGKLMLTACIDEIIELQEKIYVWDSVTNKYIETWQKGDYKGNKIEP